MQTYFNLFQRHLFLQNGRLCAQIQAIYLCSEYPLFFLKNGKGLIFGSMNRLNKRCDLAGGQLRILDGQLNVSL